MTRPAKTVRLVKGQGPAVVLSKVREKAVDLAEKADKAGISLSKRGLDGIRAQAVLELAQGTDAPLFVFAGAMTDEWDSWISAVQRAGVLG